jgi:hypothetical protein
MTETVLSFRDTTAPPFGASRRSPNGFDLLCASCNPHPGPEQITRMENHHWDAPNFDWNEFLQVAEHHGVLASVAKSLICHARDLPSQIEQSLRSTYAGSLRRNLWFAAELIRILHHFAQEQVPALPYKGPVLAQAAYGDLALRTFSDLDLLISPRDFDRARQALAEIGYVPSQELTPTIERFSLRTGYERSFDGPAGKNILELQWSLLPHFYAVDLESAGFQFDDLLARSSRIALDAASSESTIPNLSPEDSLIILCLHAAKHLWSRLIWIVDIAQTLLTPDLDLPLVMSRAQSLGIARILGVSLGLAENVLGTPIPQSGRALLTAEPVPVLGQEFASRLAIAATYDLESPEYFRHILKLRERSTDQLRYLWRLATTPGPGDLSAVKFPEPMFPLYRAVRLARLLRRLT